MYTRESHAAHCMFTGRALHDLECWDVVQETFDAPRPVDVPPDADRDYGYVSDGEQHVVYRRRAPVSANAKCRCPEAVR